MVEYAIQNHAHPILRRLPEQRVQRLSAAKLGVYLAIVSRIVFVVGIRFKNGTQIQYSHAKLLQIGKLFYNSP